MVSGAAGLGSAAGPLIGGLITSYISWRASFLLQVLVVLPSPCWPGGIADPPLHRRAPAFDLVGAILSAAGLFLVVFGILQSATYGWASPQASRRRLLVDPRAASPGVARSLARASSSTSA